jgi:hypothetical protein
VAPLNTTTTYLVCASHAQSAPLAALSLTGSCLFALVLPASLLMLRTKYATSVLTTSITTLPSDNAALALSVPPDASLETESCKSVEPPEGSLMTPLTEFATPVAWPTSTMILFN